MIQGATRAISRNSLFAAVLVGLYVLSFSLPFVLTFRVSDFFAKEPRVRFDEDALFPDATSIASQGTYLNVVDGQKLSPSADLDYVFFVWLRPSRLPKSTEKLMLVSKSDAPEGKQDGFVLGLARDGDALRPIVFWGGGEQGGRWYQFTNLDVFPGQWLLLALTFSSHDSVLGLHAVDYDPRGNVQVQVLGGYEVPPGSYGQSEAGIKIGAWGTNRYRGKVGPFAVLAGTDVLTDFRSMLKQYARHPTELPNSVRASARLWSPSSRNDFGGSHSSIELLSPLKSQE